MSRQRGNHSHDTNVWADKIYANIWADRRTAMIPDRDIAMIPSNIRVDRHTAMIPDRDIAMILYGQTDI